MLQTTRLAGGRGFINRRDDLFMGRRGPTTNASRICYTARDLSHRYLSRIDWCNSFDVNTVLETRAIDITV